MGLEAAGRLLYRLLEIKMSIDNLKVRATSRAERVNVAPALACQPSVTSCVILMGLGVGER